jgi:uncharacterized protein (TIGR02246 family)
MRPRIITVIRLTGILAFGLVVSTQADRAGADEPVQCAPLSAVDVHDLYDRWAASLTTLHPDKVLRTYAKDATFAGIGSNAVRTGFLEIRDHFVYFLQREPLAVSTSRTVRVGCNFAMDAGVQELQLRPKAKQKYETMASRYTLNYEFRDGVWLIVNHHMSTVSEEAPVAAAALAPALRTPVVAGFIKRLPDAKKPIAAAPVSPSGIETLFNGWTYTPGRWIDDAPYFPQP